MPEDRSTSASTDAPAYFPPILHDAARVSAFRRLVRSQPVMAWARARSLNDDLEQLGLIEIAKILRTYDAQRGTTAEQYVGVAIRSRLLSCVRTLSSTNGRDLEQSIDGALTTDDERRPSEQPPSDSAQNADAPDHLARTQLARAVRDEVLRLPTRQREVIELMLADHTEREIAHKLGVSVQAVNKTKQGAFEALKLSLAGTMQ